MPLTIATVTTNTTANTTTDVYFIDATSNNVTVTLPTLLGDGSTDGVRIVFRRIDAVSANNGTVAAAGGNDLVVVSSQSSQDLPAKDRGNGAIVLCSRLTTWWLIGI